MKISENIGNFQAKLGFFINKWKKEISLYFSK